MAIQPQRVTQIVGDLTGAAPTVLTLPEASSQSFKSGELVYLASGKVTVCADSATTIFGLAKTDATGTADSNILVQVIVPTTLLSMSTYHATSASAVTAVANVGIKYNFERDSYHGMVNIGLSNSAAVVIVGIDSRDATGDRYGRFLCTILGSCIQSAIGA